MMETTTNASSTKSTTAERITACKGNSPPSFKPSMKVLIGFNAKKIKDAMSAAAMITSEKITAATSLSKYATKEIAVNIIANATSPMLGNTCDTPSLV